MVENVIQIKSGIKNCVNVSSKIEYNMFKKDFIWNCI